MYPKRRWRNKGPGENMYHVKRASTRSYADTFTDVPNCNMHYAADGDTVHEIHLGIVEIRILLL